MYNGIRILCLALCTLILTVSAFALRTNRIASGLSRPVFVCSPPGDSTRLFIVEQWSALIKIKNLATNQIYATPFADLNSRVVGSGNERGLLGMAWDPDWPDSNFFYVHYNNNSGNSVISRFRVRSDNPDLADSTSETIIIGITQPAGVNFQNHKGGMIAFSPTDGYLYIGMGDGGSGNDPGNRAQSDTTRLGKMLRLDVRPLPYTIPPDNPFAADPNIVKREFWAKGLRNPWRWSFDSATGDLYIADVGQESWEEIDYESDASTGGLNWGWRCTEGLNHCTGNSGCVCPDTANVLADPILDFSSGTGSGNCSVTGGYVYRGCKIPELYGRYIYADYCSDRIWSFVVQNGVYADHETLTVDLAPDSGFTIGDISSFGVDGAGELYILDHSGGEIFKILPDAIEDCNGNGCSDSLEVALGYSPDINGNWIPDECDCIANEVTAVVLTSSTDSLYITWTPGPAAGESYRLYGSVDADAEFPGLWTQFAELVPIGTSPITHVVPLNGLPLQYFIAVTAHCPD